MSSGLTAAKCPSCKIILLRPVHRPSSSAARSSSSSESTIMHCPACSQQYSLRKGTIIPTIVLSSAKLLSGPQAKISMEAAAAVSYSPDQHRGPARIASPLVNEAAALTLACCSLRSPLRVPHPPRNLPVRSSSFTNETPRPKCNKATSKPRRKLRVHRRSGSLHLNVQDLGPPSMGISRSTSSDRISQLSNASTAAGYVESFGGKLGRVRAFLSGSKLGTSQSPSPGLSPKSVGRELPPTSVVRRRKLVTLKRGSSFSDNDLRLLGSDTETSSVEKPYFSSVEELRQDVKIALKTRNYNHLQDIYANSFSSWGNILNSFKLTGSDFGLNMELVHYAFSAMMEMPGYIQKATMKSIINCFLKDSRNYTQHKSRIKAQMVILENPQFDNPSTYVIFAQLLKQLTQMPPDTHKCVSHWLRTEYKPIWLMKLIARIQHFISRKQFPQTSPDHPTNSRTSWWIPCAARMLSLIREACLDSKPPLLPHTEFYNSTLDYLDLMSEFYAWQSSTNQKFSYCNHPFILSLSAKKYILQHDSEHQMLLTAKRSLAMVHQSEVPSPQNVFLDLKVRRSHLIEDSINELVYKKSDLKKKVKVTFTGEPGIDMGGLTKEWFLLVARRIFMPDYGLFTSYEHADFLWFSLGLTGDHRTSEYHLVGLLMGLAVYNGIILDLNFPLCCFKKLLAQPPPTLGSGSIAHELARKGSTQLDELASSLPNEQHGEAPKFTLADLASVMPTLAQSLKQLQDYEGDVDDLCYTFQVSHQAYSTVVTTDLVPDGGSVPVTNSNRNEFIDLYINHLLNKSIAHQFAAFYYGFHSICNSNALKLLCPEELEALICGFPEFDVQSLRSVTKYDGYEKTDTTIEAFWEVVEGMSDGEQTKLLQFVTGSCRVPVGGASSMDFKISRLPLPSPSSNILPMAHTCFNQLLLPPYKSKELLRKKLIIAVSNSEGFGLI